MPLSSDRHIIDEKFRDALREHRVSPSGKVWRTIYSTLNKQKYFKIPVSKIASVSFFIFLSVLGIWTAITDQEKTILVTEARSPLYQSPSGSGSTSETNSPQEKSILSVKENSVTIPKKMVGTAEDNIILLDLPSIVNSATSDNYYSTFNLQNENLISGDKSISSDISSVQNLTSDIGFLPSKSKSLAVTGRASDHGRYRFSYIEARISEDQWHPDLKGWYTGFGAALNNTWILDHAAILSDKFTYRATLGTSYSFLTGYNFSNKFGIAAAWVFCSTEGQKYKYQMINIRTVGDDQKSISLRYMKVPVIAKFKVAHWSHINQAPVITNYFLGLQYGKLLSSSVNKGPNQKQDNTFRKNEYAIVAGIDYDFLSKKSSFLTVGAQTSYGSNFYTKTAQPDIGFIHPHNMTLGLHAAYNFSMKQRPSLTQK